MKLFKWFDEHGSKINWGASFLDGDAIADLNEALLEARKEQEADMFGTGDYDIFNHQDMCLAIFDADGLLHTQEDVGKEIEVHKAIRLPSLVVRITAHDDEEGFSWEVIGND